MNTFVASTLVLLTAAVVALGFTVVSLMRQVGTVLLHVAPPRPGTAGGPEKGARLPLKLYDDFTKAAGGLLVFLGAHCPACSRVEPVLPMLVSRYPELNVVPLAVAETQMQRDEHLATLALRGRADCQDLIDLWSIPGTPFVVAIDGDRTVFASGIVNSLDQLEALAEELSAASADAEPEHLEQADTTTEPAAVASR